MGFNSKNWNDITLTTSDLNRIEKGIKDSHDTLDLLGEEISALQLRQIDNQSDLKTLLKDTPTLAKSLKELEELLNKDNNILETIKDIDQLVTKKELDTRLSGWIKITDIKQDGNSIYDGDSIINIKSKPIDTSLNINSNNAISNKAVTKAIKNLNIQTQEIDTTDFAKLSKRNTFLLDQIFYGKLILGSTELNSTSLITSNINTDKLYFHSLTDGSITKTLAELVNHSHTINDVSGLSNILNTIPAVPTWALQPNKPEYQYSEIKSTPTIPTKYSDLQADITYLKTAPVTTVNNKLGDVLIYGTDIKLAEDNTGNLTDAIIGHNSQIETIKSYIPQSTSTTNMLADMQYVKAQIASLVGSAPDTLDTLQELAEAIQNNQGTITAINNAIANKADKDHNHDTVYSKLNHNHNELYSLLTHSHNDLYSLLNHNHDTIYIKLTGGTFTGEVKFNEIDGSCINYNTGFYINKKNGGTLFGTNGTLAWAGTPDTALTMRGNATRPTYNNKEIALYSDVLNGFLTATTSQTWGNQIGTFVGGYNDSTGGSLAWRRDNPKSGQLSMIIDGTVYVNEGKDKVFAAKNWSVSQDNTGALVFTYTA